MARRTLHQILHFPRLRAILALANDSRLISPLRKNARSSLVTVRDADLEGVIVKPGGPGTSTTMILLLEDSKQGVTTCQAIFWPIHHGVWITDRVV